MPRKFFVISLPLRLSNRTLPSCRNASARKPSSFGSNSQPGDEKAPSTACASIGLSVRGMRAGLPNETTPAASAGSGSLPDFNCSSVSPHTTDLPSSRMSCSLSV